MVHRRKRISGPLTAALLVTVAMPAALGAPVAAAAPASAGTPTGPSVTLLTGDRVTLGGSRGAVFQPAPGREKIGYRQQQDEHGDITVIPADALSLVTSGRLDRRLFNVTKLVEFGYDDSSRRDVPLIVSYQPNQPRTLASAGARTVRELPSIGGSAVLADKGRTFWAGLRAQPRALGAGVERISLDGPVRATLAESVPQIGAPQAWQAGHTGKGTTVAVLDTGIDATHPDLADAVAEAKDFTGSASGTDDKVGHGTHVASTITGSGAADGANYVGKYVGVAPDTRLFVGKVLDDNGGGSESGIIAGMEWAAGTGARVVNMSLGSLFPGDGTDPMSQAVNRLTEQTGVLFVVAAGNAGPGDETIGNPGAADAALTVGAVDKRDAIAPFSSRGPVRGSQTIKPDITAPGVDIVAAKAQDSKIGEPVGERYLKLSGTSMAAPHVAGAAAIVAGEHPDWKAGQLKAALMASAKPNPALTVYEQGAGRVDLARAVTQSVYTSPASLSNGVAQWPHADDKPITSQLTYHNDGSAPLTLDVTTDVRGPDGKPAPSGMFTVQPKQITIPAGGEAAVTVTTNTTVDGPDGTYGGTVVATGGGAEVRTPISVVREVESYDVKFTVLDHNGQPTPAYNLWYLDVDHPESYSPYDASGTGVGRLPKGRFFFEAWVQTALDDSRYRTTIAIEPEITVSGNGEVVLDARQGKPIGFTVDKPNARAGQVGFGYQRRTSYGETGGIVGLGVDGNEFLRPSDTAAPGQFEFYTEARLAEPDGKGGFAGSPYLYNVRSFAQGGRVPADLVRHVPDRDLVKGRSHHAASAPGRIGVREFMVSAPLPFSIDEYYTPDTPWDQLFQQVGEPNQFPPDTSVSTTTPRTYQLGQPAVEQWNAAVFGPALSPIPSNPGFMANRTGDQLTVNVPLFTDQVTGRAGGAPSTGVTALYRDGRKVGETDNPGYGVFTVPAESGGYRVHTEATRVGGSDLSTKVSADWTFRSARVDGTTQAPLPLMAVRFAPKLDQHNQAAVNPPLWLPIYVERNGTPGKVRTLTLQVSYDDGATWRPTPVIPAGEQWATVVSHPAGTKFVSLKATAKDTDGNTVEQTIIRAYAVK